MPAAFAISRLSDSVRLDQVGRAKATFVVVNNTDRQIRARLQVIPLGADASWLSVEGDSERDFPPGGSVEFTVAISVPFSVTPNGSYAFRLVIKGVDNPNEVRGNGHMERIDVEGGLVEERAEAPAGDPVRAAIEDEPPGRDAVRAAIGDEPPGESSGGIGRRSGAEAAFDESIRHLSTGVVVFNPPGQMTVGHRERIEVRIAKHEVAGLTAGLRGRGPAQTEHIPVNTFMATRLIGQSFEVKSLSSEEQIVGDAAFSQWEWDVVAEHGGSQTLCLSVSVRIKVAKYSEERMDLPVFERQIEVTVNPGYQAKRFVKANWRVFVPAILGSSVLVWVLDHLVGH